MPWGGHSKYLCITGSDLRNALQARDRGFEARAFLQIIEQIKWNRSAIPRHVAVGLNVSLEAQVSKLMLGKLRWQKCDCATLNTDYLQKKRFPQALHEDPQGMLSRSEYRIWTRCLT
jgi:hypothetical protein